MAELVLPTRAVRWRRSPWLRFALRRGAGFVVSLFVLATAAFGMIHAVPGDPVRAALGSTAPRAIVEAKRHALGLDQPLWRQYVNYLDGVRQGDMGVSLTSDLPVGDIIRERLPATVAIAGLAFAVTLLIAIPLGMVIGVLTSGGRRPRTELAFGGVTGAFGATPDFLVAVALVFVFAVNLALLPVAGKAGTASYILPIASLAVGPIALLSRIVRVETVRVLGEDYMRTARAKRLPARLLYRRHALPNILTATLTLSGLLLTGLLAGTVLVENVLAWPGLGTALTQSVPAKDYPVVQGLALVYGAGVLLINLVVDVLIALADPRSTIRET